MARRQIWTASTTISAVFRTAERQDEFADWLDIVKPRGGFGWYLFRLMTSWGTFGLLLAIAILPTIR